MVDKFVGLNYWMAVIEAVKKGFYCILSFKLNNYNPMLLEMSCTLSLDVSELSESTH